MDYGKQEAVAELLHTCQERHSADLDESINNWQGEMWTDSGCTLIMQFIRFDVWLLAGFEVKNADSKILTWVTFLHFLAIRVDKYQVNIMACLIAKFVMM